MQQSVSSQALRRLRTLMLALVAASVVAGLPAVASAMGPSPSPMNSPFPVLANLTAAATSPYTADVSVDVVSNGGVPPIYQRGFVYARTVDSTDPQLGFGFNTLYVPGTLGSMTRTMTGLTPGTDYSVNGWADNPSGTGYTSPAATFTTPCPVITLAPLPDSFVNEGYNHYASAIGGSGAGYTYAVTGGSLPPGMTLDTNVPGTGLLSGQPTTAGTYNFTIGAADFAWNCAGFRNYTLTVDLIYVSPRKLNFASQVVGVTSPETRIDVLNFDLSNSAPLGALVPSTGQFAINNTDCTDPLPPLTYCFIDIAYTPTAASLQTGTLSVGPLVVSLRGVGTVTTPAQVYVSSNNLSSVLVIDPPTNVVRTVVGVGDSPSTLTALPGGGKVYVPNKYSGTVSVISTSDYSVSATVPVGGQPTAVGSTPAGDEVWVANTQWPYTLNVIETTFDTVIASIPDNQTNQDGNYCLYGSQGIVANPANHDMYVINAYNGSVCVFDRLTHVFVRTIWVGGSPIHAVVLPDGSALYVNDSVSGVVARIDLGSDTVTPLPGIAGYKMDIKADGSKIYLARPSGDFGYINTATNSFTAIPLTGAIYPFAVAVDDAADRVYVGDGINNSVYFVRLSTNTEITNPGLPITDSSLADPFAIAVIKPNVAPTGAIPTVTSLTAGVPAGFSESVGADVTSDGGAPVFERGFVYVDTLSGIDPMPGTPGVFTKTVSGTTGPMATTLTGLTPGTDYTFRAYAKNFIGTGVTADPAGTFTTAAVSCSGVSIDNPTIPNGVLGVPYAGATLTASGDPGPYSYAITSGALPPGLSLSADTISGTPTATGTYTVVISATATANGCNGATEFDMAIGTAVVAGDVVISEFRTRGTSGQYDDYVELANRSSADIVVAAQDGSGGWSIGRPGLQVAVIPNGTVIEKGSRFLATGSNFSLWDYGYPDWVWSGDVSLACDLVDDAGLALFTTADTSNYSAATVLDAVGGAAETDTLFYEGTPLVKVVQDDGFGGPANPPAQTAWVRRTGLDGTLSDTGDNDRDFVFVATNAGMYGPLNDVPAVLGSPNPEDSYAVRDVLQAELPGSLVDPGKGQDQYPNRYVEPYAYAVEYRRKLTNNTGKDIGSLAYKVINLTTINSRNTVTAPLQAKLAASDSSSLTLEVPVGSNNFIDVAGSLVDYPWMYPLSTCCDTIAGMNSRVIVPFDGGGQSAKGISGRKSFSLGPAYIHQGESIAVNIRARIWSPGYYLFVIIPEVSPDAPPSCSDCEFLKNGARRPRAESLRPKR